MTPETIEDEVLGKMAWDSANECWTNQIVLPPGLPVKIDFRAELDEIAANLVRARRIYSLVRDSEEMLRRAASTFLLGIFNEGDWCEGKSLDENAFIAKMTLESIEIEVDGSAGVYYDDGGLFWGHKIVAEIDSDGRVEDATIVG